MRTFGGPRRTYDLEPVADILCAPLAARGAHRNSMIYEEFDDSIAHSELRFFKIPMRTLGGQRRT
jgi:hypothetical protein